MQKRKIDQKIAKEVLTGQHEKPVINEANKIAIKFAAEVQRAVVHWRLVSRNDIELNYNIKEIRQKYKDAF